MQNLDRNKVCSSGIKVNKIWSYNTKPPVFIQKKNDLERKLSQKNSTNKEEKGHVTIKSDENDSDFE
jgi:hypothetical protein